MSSEKFAGEQIRTFLSEHRYGLNISNEIILFFL